MIKKVFYNKQKILKLKIGQITLEFLFCMVVVLLMIYGIIYVFRWTGVDLAQRRIAHDTRIGNFRSSIGPRTAHEEERQMDPYFYTPVGMDAIWKKEWKW